MTFLHKRISKKSDAGKIFDEAKSFILASLADSSANELSISATISGLKNNSFRDHLSGDHGDLIEQLEKTVRDPKRSDTLREHSLALLGKLAPRSAVTTIAKVVSDGSAKPNLLRRIKKLLSGGLTGSVLEDEPGMPKPPDCIEIEIDECVKNQGEWKNWLARLETQ